MTIGHFLILGLFLFIIGFLFLRAGRKEGEAESSNQIGSKGFSIYYRGFSIIGWLMIVFGGLMSTLIILSLLIGH